MWSPALNRCVMVVDAASPLANSMPTHSADTCPVVFNNIIIITWMIWIIYIVLTVKQVNHQPLPLMKQVPSPETWRVASHRESGIKSLPQHSASEYQWIT
jgi:hypothetical protein